MPLSEAVLSPEALKGKKMEYPVDNACFQGTMVVES